MKSVAIVLLVACVAFGCFGMPGAAAERSTRELCGHIARDNATRAIEVVREFEQILQFAPEPFGQNDPQERIERIYHRLGVVLTLANLTKSVTAQALEWPDALGAPIQATIRESRAASTSDVATVDRETYSFDLPLGNVGRQEEVVVLTLRYRNSRGDDESSLDAFARRLALASVHWHAWCNRETDASTYLSRFDADEWFALLMAGDGSMARLGSLYSRFGKAFVMGLNLLASPCCQFSRSYYNLHMMSIQ